MSQSSNDKPVITAPNQDYKVGDSIDPLKNVTASDKEDGTTKVTVAKIVDQDGKVIDSIPNDKAGKYTVTYTTTDADGNTVTKDATISVRSNDKPVITAPNQDYKVGDSIDPLKNVTASDKENGTTKVTVAKIVDQDGKVIDSIPNDKAGKYTVTYTTTDADGNTVTKDATISVRSNDKPVITAPNQDYKVGDSIDPLKNVTASDKEDGTTKVTVAKIVDQDGKVIDSIPNDKAGKYTVTYTTTDADGNTVTKDATISVRSNDKPVITAPNQDYKVGDSIDPLKNVTASDKENGTTKVTVAKIVDQDGKVIDSIPNDKAGKYTVTYTTTDADGNTVTKDATISVRSNDKPVITAPNQDYKVGDSIDPLKNVTASDKENGTTKVTVAKIVDQDGKVIDSIPNDKAGKYTVTYTTTDADGNTVTKDATISVRSNDKPVITAPNQDYKVGDSIDPLKNVTASDKENGTTKVTVAKIVDQDGKVIDSIPNDKAGKYTVTYTTTDADGNTVTKDATISVRSNDKPVITAPNQDYKVGDSIDPLKNVTASDKENGTTKVTVAKIVDQDGKVIDSIPNDKAGKYTVTYTTTDADGNTVTKDATISVRSNDKPVITAPNQDYKVGDSIDPLKNVTASDKEDGTTKVTVAKIVDQDGKVIDSIPNDKAGKYTVTYTTTDADGNTVTKDATISVRSNDKPVITAPNQDYKVGDSIDPLKNVTASDKENGTTKVTVAKIVDQDGKVIDSIPNDKAGKYTVTYTTTDADGNTVTKDATISVRSNDKPVITAPNQDYKVGDSIDPLKNVTASDKEDGTTKVTVAKIVDQDGKVIDSIPNDKAGKYTVTYTTTDADGNTVTKDATISVRSNDKPVITAPNQDYKVGDSIDPLKNVTASDKENGTTKVTVAKIVDQDGKVIDSIPNDKAGKYTVTYTTTDADGNTVTKDATISVRSNEKPGNGTDNGNPSSNQPGNPSQPSNATNNGVINTSTNIGSKVNNGAVNSPELPQTGENNRQSQTMSFIGVLLAMFGSLLGFLGIKKRRND
jgi:methionine-rich copper-binding protein CopC